MVFRRINLSKIKKSIIPNLDNILNLGSATKRWAALFILTLFVTTITVGTIKLTDEGGLLLINASVNITGNIDAQQANFTRGFIGPNEIATLADLTGGNVTVTSIIRIQNKQGTTIDPLKLVFFSGFNVGQNAPEAQLATSLDSDKHAECITSETIANNAFGSCVITGLINDVDTSAFAALSELHLGKTGGNLVVAEPLDVVCLQAVGLVLRSHASAGVLFIHITNECVEVPPYSEVPETLTVANTTLFVNDTRVGIGTISPTSSLEIVGNLTIRGVSNNSIGNMSIIQLNSTCVGFRFDDGTTGGGIFSCKA